MNLKNACKSLLIVCLLFGALSKALSQEVFNSYVIVNGLKIGEPVWVDFYKQGDSRNAILIQPILTSLSEVLSKAIMFNITENIDEDGKVSFDQLNEFGVNPSVDINTLDVTFKVESENKRQSQLKVTNISKLNRTDVLRPDFISGYLNLRTSHEFTGNDGVSSGSAVDSRGEANSLAVEKVLSIGDVAIETQYIFSDSEINNNQKTSRLYTRATLDDEKNALRYRLGDLNHSIRGFQESVIGAGASFQKEFTIKPALFRSSFNKYNFNLDVDSIVEIFVNGNLVKRETLPQGPVELSDFPFNSGENEVRVRVTDLLGNIRNLNFSDINDSRLLTTGMSDFSFNYVLPRKGEALDVNIGEAYAANEGVFSGFYHRGIRKNWVAGLDLQYSKDRALFGVENLIGDELGLVKLNVAGSKDNDLEKSGGAVRVEHESLLLINGALANFRIFSSGEYRSRDFTNFISDQNGSKYKVRVSVGQNFRSSIRASLGAAKEWYYEQTSRTFITSTFGWTFYKNFDLSSNMRVNLENRDDTSVLFSLNWQSRTSNQQLTSTFDPVANVANAELVTYPLDGRQNLRTSVGAENTENTQRAFAGVDYFNQRFEARLAHSSALLERDSSIHNTRLNFGLSLAYTDSSVALSRPIENSFAIVSLSGRPAGFNVPIGKGFNSQRGEINSFGPAVISNLAPYYSDRAKLDITHMPYGYTLSEEAFNFKSRYRSGVHIDIAVDGEVSLAGRAVFDVGTPAEYITGTVYSYNNGKRGGVLQQFFTGGGGEFSVEKIEQKTYILSFESEDTVYNDVIVKVNKSIGVVEIKDDIVLIKSKRKK